MYLLAFTKSYKNGFINFCNNRKVEIRMQTNWRPGNTLLVKSIGYISELTSSILAYIISVIHAYLSYFMYSYIEIIFESRTVSKDQESIQSITTPDPGYHMGK